MAAISAPTNRHDRHSNRSIDIIVHGATGYTGRRVARHLASKHPHLTLAICGRSDAKLAAVAAEIGWDESKRQSSTFVVADVVEGIDDLVSAFSGAKVVIACAGPYRQCGLPVLKAAIDARCDYLDLCGEPQFFDDALVSFDRQARDLGLLAVHAAAFDCVPAELGAALAERQLLLLNENPSSSGDGDGETVECAGIEVIHTVQNVASANATTFHAAVDGFYAASSGELSVSRKKVKESYPEFKETAPPARPKAWPRVPETPGAIMPGYNEELGLRTMKFVGADASAVKLSWKYLRSRIPEHSRKGKHVPEPRLSVLIGMEGDNSLAALKLMAYGATFSTLARWKWGCNMLHSNPEAFSNGLFTSKGPTEEELEQGGFTTFVTAYGTKHCPGSSNQVARVKISGPEPGYVATPILIVALACTILDAGKGENHVKLSFEGGVTLPGALFGDCDKVYDNMRKEGVSFDVVDDFKSESSPV
mmetsp:Transcript_727/g.1026  ORF Transcript_727/g.1026 Transcript_727/m.1026 type:complete len:478 (-) Transcript_727:1651-3084(-)|eukprot:CAMPEP_0196133604 /NCGR_PEP_ID=MMETSP0910-20130528/2758_1 /TAXON_ID=49265 /ORGANISM="Thalassiosira rotula, Strain GSO102" /LENGTH=477 /DNA_ID=CAMNT_0041393347 /DNA_START=1 /DNA_END=1434 /DNA_ORIENTATION=+